MLRLRGEIPREQKWDVVVDLFFYREPEEAEKEEQAAKELPAAKPEPVIDTQDDWTTTVVNADNWVDDAASSALVPPATAATPAYNANEDWAADRKSVV